jgi:NTP pyrophosphatase (non-canonical NTP hydrolase)
MQFCGCRSQLTSRPCPLPSTSHRQNQCRGCASRATLAVVSNEFDALRDRLRRFAAARCWGRSHSARNLALALVGEVGELAAELQWVNDADLKSHLSDRAAMARLGEEAADVLIYLVQFADACGIDVLAEAHAKIDRNEIRYPRTTPTPLPVQPCSISRPPTPSVTLHVSGQSSNPYNPLLSVQPPLLRHPELLTSDSKRTSNNVSSASLLECKDRAGRH